MGNEASTVDAALYACLRILFQSPMENKHLQERFMKFPNLKEFMHRFHAAYFSS
jgi:type II secretory pathway component PulF